MYVASEVLDDLEKRRVRRLPSAARVNERIIMYLKCTFSFLMSVSLLVNNALTADALNVLYSVNCGHIAS